MVTKTKKTTTENQDSLPTGRVGKYFYAVGKRKRAVATVRLYENGKGDFLVNGKKLKDFSSVKEHEELLTAPLRLLKAQKAYDVSANVCGGGIKGQVDAIKHAISRALTVADIMLRPTLKRAGFLTRDPRIKERKKPGMRKARRAPQWSKR